MWVSGSKQLWQVDLDNESLCLNLGCLCLPTFVAPYIRGLGDPFSQLQR
jgi:hypothetical protein